MRKRTVFLASLSALGLTALVVAQDNGVKSVIGNVFLQNTTPGTAQVGHATLTGTFRAGQVFVQQASTATIPIVGNSLSTSGNTVGGSFSSASPSGIAVRGTATAMSGSNIGVRGESRSSQGTGVLGQANGEDAFGVWARSLNGFGPALVAENAAGGVSARFLGSTQTFGSAFVQGTLSVHSSDASDNFRAYDTGVASQVDFLRAGNSASGRVLVGSNEAKFELFSQNAQQVLLLADSNGVGHVVADVKNFVQPDPDSESRNIVYASLEGPEAAAYIRGTARLINGSVFVALPRHFQNVSTPDGMTVQLTPCSADSEGLAVVSQTTSGFRVRELHKGQGTYEFHWEVKAVRRGFTDYQVYEPWDRHIPPGSGRDDALQARRLNAQKVYGIHYAPQRP